MLAEALKGSLRLSASRARLMKSGFMGLYAWHYRLSSTSAPCYAALSSQTIAHAMIVNGFLTRHSYLQFPLDSSSYQAMSHHVSQQQPDSNASVQGAYDLYRKLCSRLSSCLSAAISKAKSLVPLLSNGTGYRPSNDVCNV